MEKRARLMLTLPGSGKRFAPDVILADLAKKLRGGVYDIPRVMTPGLSVMKLMLALMYPARWQVT